MKKKTGFDIDRFIAILVDHKKIKPAEGKALKAGFQDALNANFDDFLLSQGLIDRAALLGALSIYYQVPAFDVVGYFFDHQLLLQFPKDVLLRNQMIPLETDELSLVMIASDPSDANLLPIIGKFVSYDIQFNVGIAQDITDAVKEYYDKSLTDLSNADKVERQRQEAIGYLQHERETTMEEEVERLDDIDL